MIIFYTLPPKEVPYPYILINANNPELGIQYIVRHWRHVKSVIIDSGVEIFRKDGVRDYPGGPRAWISRLVRLYNTVRNIVPGAAVYATCPDYPDDYRPGSLWLSDKATNIERTAENVRLCTSQYPNISWLIPIQGHYRNPGSLLRSLDYYWDMGVFEKYSYYAVANLCVEVDTDLIHRSILAVRKRLKELGVLDKVMLHIFGLKIAALRRIKHDIHSFDSTAWTRPVDTTVRAIRNASAKTQWERVVFFCRYLWRLKNLYGVEIPQESLDRCGELEALV